MNTSDSQGDLTRYKYYEQRLKTFYNWPKQMIPDKYCLAKSGFVYTGRGDKVRCFQCGVGVDDWERTDDADKEHVKWSPNCDYLKMVGWRHGVNVSDTPNTGFGGFGQPKQTGGFDVTNPQTSVTKDNGDRPFGQTSNKGFNLGVSQPNDRLREPFGLTTTSH